MRDSSATSTTFGQWLADRAPGVIVRPMQGSDRPHRRPPSAPHLDRDRLAELANDVLGMAIKLAVMLEAAQQMTEARQNSAFGVPAEGGLDNG